MTLKELNAKEISLVNQVESTFGLIEEKNKQLHDLGVFKEYAEVFTKYSQLFKKENDGLEALKRAVFIKWYEYAEPSFLSGINNLPNHISSKVFEELKSKIENRHLDFELQWMLHFYVEIADFAFSDFIDVNIIPAIKNREIWEHESFDTTQFNNRGQMGIYWTTIIESNKMKLRFEQGNNDRKNSAR